VIDDPESADALDPGVPAATPGQSQATPQTSPKEANPGRAPRPWARPRTSRRLAAVGVVLLAAIGFLLYKGLTSALVYFKTANEAIADRAQLGNSTFQLEGVVLKGTVKQLGGGRVGFTVAAGGAAIPVVNDGEPPQLFRAGIAVVVVGHFVGSSNDFASDQVLVKHSQQYIAAHPSRVTVPSQYTGGTVG
jgi:cytochrome c-type biogenesis protein CcmE